MGLNRYVEELSKKRIWWEEIWREFWWREFWISLQDTNTWYLSNLLKINCEEGGVGNDEQVDGSKQPKRGGGDEWWSATRAHAGDLSLNSSCYLLSYSCIFICLTIHQKLRLDSLSKKKKKCFEYYIFALVVTFFFDKMVYFIHI